MGSISSETNTPVFSSPDSAVEPPNTKKFETSISVSSLAEKFEKSGDFSKSEENTLTDERLSSESVMERSHPLSENNSENKSIVPDINGSTTHSNGKAKDEIVSCKNENCVSENSGTDLHETAVTEKGKETEIKASKTLTDPETSVKEVMNPADVNISKLSSSASDEKNSNPASQNGSGIFTESESSNEIKERVMYFLYRMSNQAENSVSDKLTEVDSTTPGNDAQSSLSDLKQGVEGSEKKFTLKDLEQSFIDALNMVISKDEVKTADTLPVPSIQITEASDREDSSSDDAEETKPKTVETEVKASVEENSDTTQSKENEQSSTTTNSQVEVKDQSEVSAEERKAVFYISSSDLPAEPSQESAEASSELEQSSETVRPTSTRTPESNETRSSCLRSKTCQGTTFAISFTLTVFGCMLYSFAHDKKVPDFCEYLGLVIAILSGIVGAVSCFCYSCLDILPGPSRAGYELIPDTGYVPSLPPQNEAANAQDLDDSWSSEKERSFRRQNGMSSTRTSEASLKSDLGEYLVIKKSEHRELVDKTELLKKGVIELLDSFNVFMSKLEPIDKLVEMESGMMNG